MNLPNPTSSHQRIIANAIKHSMRACKTVDLTIYLSATGNSFPVVFLYWPRMKSVRRAILSAVVVGNEARVHIMKRDYSRVVHTRDLLILGLLYRGFIVLLALAEDILLDPVNTCMQ